MREQYCKGVTHGTWLYSVFPVQLQERLTSEIAHSLEKVVGATGVAVVVEATYVLRT